MTVHRSGGITQTPDAEASYFEPVLYRNGKREQPKGYCTDLFFEAALEFIGQNRQQPFFVYLPLASPHTPILPTAVSKTGQPLLPGRK